MAPLVLVAERGHKTANFKRAFSLALSSLISLNAVGALPNTSYAASSDAKLSSNQKETDKKIAELQEQIRELSKKVENNDFKKQLKTLEDQVKDLEKRAKKGAKNKKLDMKIHDQQVRGFLNVLQNLKTIALVGAVGLGAGTFFSIITSLGLIAATLTVLLSGLGVSSITAWIYYLKGYVQVS